MYRRAVRTHAIAGVALLIMVGCGAQQSSSDVPHANHKAGKTRPVRWNLVSPPRDNVVRIGVAANWCYGAPKPRIASVRVDEKKKRVILTALLEDRNKGGANSTCADLESGATKTVELPNDLSDRALYDGGVSPAEKRWPRR